MLQAGQLAVGVTLSAETWLVGKSRVDVAEEREQSGNP